jgi:hypothetical protein
MALLRPHEPGVLYAARILTIILLTAGFIYTAWIASNRFVSPALVYREETISRSIPVPAFLITGPSIIIRDLQAELIGTESSHVNATIQPIPVSSLSTTSRDDDDDASLAMLWLQPAEGNVLCPKGAKDDVFKGMSNLRLRLNIANHTNGTTNNASDYIYITAVSSQERPAENELKQLDLHDAVSWYVQPGQHYHMHLRAWEFITIDGSVSYRYDTDVSPTNPGSTTDATSITLSVYPSHSVVGQGEDARFAVVRQISMVSMTWVDLLVTFGSLLSVAMLIYTILFGSFRLKPWGIIQRYFLRGYMLARLPTGTTWVPVQSKRHLFGRKVYNMDERNLSKDSDLSSDSHASSNDSSDQDPYAYAVSPISSPTKAAFTHKDPESIPPTNTLQRHVMTKRPPYRGHFYRLSNPDDDQPPPWAGGSPSTPFEAAILNRVEWLESRWRETRRDHVSLLLDYANRLAEVEAFQRRVELFYHQTDLFHADHQQSR